MPKLKNFSPAAADARERWKKILTLPELYPRDEEFNELIRTVAAGLRDLCRTDARVLLLTAAGTGALECAVAALPVDKRIVIIRNGYFGQRLFDLAAFHHLNVFPFDLPFGQPLQEKHEADLIRFIQRKKADVIICVHLETSSTVLNDVDVVGRIGRALNLITLIDGVSSIGSVDCPLDDWNVSCFVGSVYKALMCPPGLSFLMAKSDFLSIATRKWSFYYDISKLIEASQADRFLWIPSVLSLQCLDGTLEVILSRGRQNYFADLEGKAAQFRRWIAEGDLEIIGDPEVLSPCFTAIKLKENNASRWLALLKEKHGMVVGKGMGESPEGYLRIGHYPHNSLSDLKDLAAALVDTSKRIRA